MQGIENELDLKVQAYEEKYKEFCDFLKSARTEDADERINEVSKLHESRIREVQVFRDKLVGKEFKS